MKCCIIQCNVLIETLWNVKVLRPLRGFHFQYRINRNIVECKVLQTLSCVPLTGVLIETLWNVKVYTTEDHRRQTIVLIETLWNVKLTTALYTPLKAPY